MRGKRDVDDFGAQNSLFMSPKTYRTLFKPFHVKVNDWIHTHTTWKTFIHTCGSIWRLLDDFVDAGFDCVNPVQTSAADMDPEALKAKYGNPDHFWEGDRYAEGAAFRHAGGSA